MLGFFFKFLCPVIISATVATIGEKFYIMIHIGPGQIVSPFGGDAPRGSPKSEIFGLNFGHLTATISKTVSCSVTCQLELNTRASGVARWLWGGAVA